MKILFLDDMESRHMKYSTKHGDDTVFKAYSAGEAISLLENESPFDLASLDHDLKGVYLPSDSESGYAVAMYIADMEERLRPAEVIVHSWNEKGAEKMINVLSRAGIRCSYEPFE